MSDNFKAELYWKSFHVHDEHLGHTENVLPVEVAQRMLDEIDRLRAENASYKTAWEQSDKACSDLTEKVIPNLRAENEALRRDAECFRWSVENVGWRDWYYDLNVFTAGKEKEQVIAEIYAAIDAAMREQK